MLLHGQIHGGIAQGAGQALMEDIHFDAQGQLVTGSFMDYAMPHAHDFCAMEVESNPVPTKTNPLGVKGAGEAGCVGALPAVANALVDALVGIRRQAHRNAGDAGARLARDAEEIDSAAAGARSRRDRGADCRLRDAAGAADAGRIRGCRPAPTTSGRCAPVRRA